MARNYFYIKINMKNFKILSILLFFTFKFTDASLQSHINEEINEISKINFHESMRFDLYKKYVSRNISKEFLQRLFFFKRIYQRNLPSKISDFDYLKIPRKIHQIWLGSELPKKFAEISEKWKQMHPSWEYKLWTDDNIKELFPLYNQEIFDQCKNLGEKSDILRYEIIYRFGGLYVDVDYECVKSFEIFSYLYNFYAGIEPLDASSMLIGNAFFGSCAQHPILKYCIETIKNYRDEKIVTHRTGPWQLTRAICNVCKKIKDSIIFFPTSFFYPLGYEQRNIKFEKNDILKNESFGIHYWAGSWTSGPEVGPIKRKNKALNF
jgi:mannosyltransferase OCH1-like enzyme